MHVVFRTDASLVMGQGHVMRCLTLANALRAQGIRSTFVCRQHSGNMCDFIESSGFAVRRLPMGSTFAASGSTLPHDAWLGATWAEDAMQTSAVIAIDSVLPTWLIVDHYALDTRWENALRPAAQRIMAIDDIADRAHTADLLLDQNFYPDMAQRYAQLLNLNCIQLLGPKYSLLRDEFIEFRQHPRPRDGSVKRGMVFFGGSDTTNETGKALDAVALLNRPDIEFDIVIGAANPHKDELTDQCAKLTHVNLHCQVSNMAQLMHNADLALGAGGTATWERCVLGLPALVLSVADNQIAIAEGVDQLKAQRYLGAASTVSPRILADAMTQAIEDPRMLEEMSNKALALVDTHGTQRVAAALKEFT
jgi:UDP-2,4-diacetamido-2,4,6-trideoxy-beta-L-altropyranose hydrolase